MGINKNSNRILNQINHVKSRVVQVAIKMENARDAKIIVKEMEMVVILLEIIIATITGLSCRKQQP